VGGREITLHAVWSGLDSRGGVETPPAKNTGMRELISPALARLPRARPRFPLLPPPARAAL